MAYKKEYSKAGKSNYGSGFKGHGSRTKKTEKPEYKPKRGPNDGSGFMVQ